MIDRTLVRALITSAALAAAGVFLSGCDTDEISLATNAKANQPVPPKLIQAMVDKDMDLQSPILIRLFKMEAEVEVWKQNRSGQFALLKTYPICRWSGDLGPKVREGDRQAPEGFYPITPGLMNPTSAYYLSFNTGYPNTYDAALGHTGSQLMVHGDCSSRGCYAMTDEQIAEIYSLGRESFFGGQKSFQFQAYPFRMTPLNMAKHRNNPNMAFWKMIKVGYDHFELTRQEPKVTYCEKKYVFDAIRAPNAKSDPVFNVNAKCPPYAIEESLADAMQQREAEEPAEYNKLVARGTPVAKLNTGIDGGMNQVFASHVPGGSTGLSEGGDGQGLSLLSISRAPGTIPGTVNPPRAPWQAQQGMSLSLRPRRPRKDLARGSPPPRRHSSNSPRASSPASGARSASAAPTPRQARRLPRTRQAEGGSQAAAEGVQAGRDQAGCRAASAAKTVGDGCGCRTGSRCAAPPPRRPRTPWSPARSRSWARTRSTAASPR